MFQYLYSMWTKNNGNLILSLAAAIALVACCSWYFDLLPQIELRPSAPSNLVEAETGGEPNSLFVATIIGPQKSGKLLKGYVELYPPYSDILPDSEPVLRKPFELGKDENVTVVVFEDAAAGPYYPVVFLDLNSNGSLDFDKNKRPMEPVRTLVYPHGTPRQLTELEAALDLNDPAYLTFQFSQVP